ncbi:YciE/YciF ferroxidase family protein [Psychroflexus montanilacus]|uniref:YciE/YciF ferroxidase family protein n=1 Tax=Psychroflexus montanilacus TaxID=2873598 RepID=UPI001CD02C95|nr:ferritin-like domain-containing protein [Psychroflexus montanilacus]MBZ9650923.1 ferritin-like domain-containing protein [Psychroflexus montanilacus]
MDSVIKNLATPLNGKNTNKQTYFSKKMKSSQLMKLFEDGLKDMYWAEIALTKAIPSMIENSTCTELIETLTYHLGETEGHVGRLEQVFEMLDEKAVAVRCEAMSGLIKEASKIIEDCEVGAMRDAGIISAEQKIVHYKIASYGSLRQFTETLGLNDASALLKNNLDEEIVTDEKLTDVALSAVNIVASKLEFKN